MKTSKNSRTATTSGTQLKPEQTVPDSHPMIHLQKKALLAECRQLARLAKFDLKAGISIWPHIPGNFNDCGKCTNGATLIAQKFGGFVAGYNINQTDSQTLIGASAGGHDFAVVGNFIVDWWGWQYELSLALPVLTRDEGVSLGKYKLEKHWKIVSLFDPGETCERTNSQEPIKVPARIKYEPWLEKFRPIANPFDTNASFNGWLFETYGREVEFVLAQPQRLVWTLVDCDGQCRILEGYHYVNRLGYFITEIPSPKNRRFSIVVE